MEPHQYPSQLKHLLNPTNTDPGTWTHTDGTTSLTYHPEPDLWTWTTPTGNSSSDCHEDVHEALRTINP